MIWYVIIGFFAAVGLLFLLWLVFGALLPGSRPGTVVLFCPQGREKALLQRYRWLRDLGLVRCRLVLLESRLPLPRQKELTQHFPGVRFCTLEQWQSETEKGT